MERRGRASMDAWAEPRTTGGRTCKDHVGEVGMAKLATEEEKGRNPRGTAGRGPRRWEGIRQRAGGDLSRSPTGAPDPAASRYAFLLDKALLICKRRGDTYDLKDFVNLHSFQVRDDSSGERDNKKVRLGGCNWGTSVLGVLNAA